MSDGDICARHFRSGKSIRVRWRDGQIRSVRVLKQPSPPDRWIAPTLLDLQVNGYGGIDFQQDRVSLAELLLATRRLRAAGCGRYLLTLMTEDWSRMLERLRRFRTLRRQSRELRHAIAGWHIEGPFLSAEPGYCGAHDPSFMIDPAPKHLRELRRITKNDPLLLTLAPERSGALDAVPLAASLGMRVSLGHTNAPIDTIAQAIQRGAAAFTHLG